MDYVARLVNCGFTYPNASWLVDQMMHQGKERELIALVTSAERMAKDVPL